VHAERPASELPRPKVTADDVGKVYGLRPALVLAVARSGHIPSLRIGRRVRFDLDEVDRHIREGGASLSGGWRHQPSVAAAAAPTRRGRPRRVGAV
jgi:excisionase family DNA binding protein